MKTGGWMLTACTLGIGSAWAHPPSGPCDPTYTQTRQSTSQLRRIADDCPDQELAMLYYNRAYHAELVAEGRTLSRIATYGRNDADRHLETYRIYIAMIENLSPIWFPDPRQRVAFLNAEYDHRGEAIELHLRGYASLVSE